MFEWFEDLDLGFVEPAPLAISLLMTAIMAYFMFSARFGNILLFYRIVAVLACIPVGYVVAEKMINR